MAIGDSTSSLVAIAILGIVLALLWRRSGRRRSEPAPNREDIPYSVYTTDYDVECPLAALPELLERDGITGDIPNNIEVVSADARRAQFDEARQSAARDFTRSEIDPEKRQFLLLLDLSGSMVNAMPAAAGAICAWRDWVMANGNSCAILGFTTRGWRGGLAREAWISNGRPPYPGRLCALLHVIIADFQTKDASLAWDVLLRPDILRENVDGEALRLAQSHPPAASAHQRRIIVVSDGAPVDDSTLTENGSEFLWRDIRAAINEVQDSGMELHGVGLSYRVNEFYENAHFAESAEKLTAALVDASG